MWNPNRPIFKVRDNVTDYEIRNKLAIHRYLDSKDSHWLRDKSLDEIRRFTLAGCDESFFQLVNPPRMMG